MIPRAVIRSLLAHFSILFLVSVPLVAAAKGTKLGGHVELNADSKNKNDTEVDMSAKLELDTPRLKGFKAHVEAEGSAVDRDVYFEDVYIQYKFSKKIKATLGYSKKILGWEYETGKKRRLTIHRSPFYKKMEALGLVGRQLNLRVNVRLGKKKTGTFISGALGGDNSLDYNAQFSLQRKSRYWGFGIWSLVESHRIDGASIPVYSETLAWWQQTEWSRVALEWFHGVDSQRTEFQELLGDSRSVHFMGPKFDFSLRFRLKEELILVPLLQASLIFDDIKKAKENTLHFLAGAQLKWRGLVVAVNAATYGVNSINEPYQRYFNRRSYYGQIIYYF